MSMKIVAAFIGCLLGLSFNEMWAQTTHPPVEVIQATAPDAAVLKARKGSYSFDISGADWTDTGVEVTPADKLSFTATGNLTLADGRTAPPDGLARGWKDLICIYPL